MKTGLRGTEKWNGVRQEGFCGLIFFYISFCSLRLALHHEEPSRSVENCYNKSCHSLSCSHSELCRGPRKHCRKRRSEFDIHTSKKDFLGFSPHYSTIHVRQCMADISITPTSASYFARLVTREYSDVLIRIFL